MNITLHQPHALQSTS